MFLYQYSKKLDLSIRNYLIMFHSINKFLNNLDVQKQLQKKSHSIEVPLIFLVVDQYYVFIIIL
jgi:hypothetical protein